MAARRAAHGALDQRRRRHPHFQLPGPDPRCDDRLDHGVEGHRGPATTYQYDSLGRVHRITPPAASELSTFVCYEGPTRDDGVSRLGEAGLPGRRVERRASRRGSTTSTTASAVSCARSDSSRRSPVVKRFTLYDGAGNAYFTLRVGRRRDLGVDLARTSRPRCVFSGGTYAAGAALGGARNLPPLLRPVRSAAADRRAEDVEPRHDRSHRRRARYSDTREAVQTYCVNATFSTSQPPTCASGGFNATTTTQKDAFGRDHERHGARRRRHELLVRRQREAPTVTQGAQIRTFAYDANGFLRSETTPERGVVTYDTIGSLGNVRGETQPGGLSVCRTFDFAGRLVEEDAPARNQVRRPLLRRRGDCVDGSPGFAGGSPSGGQADAPLRLQLDSDGRAGRRRAVHLQRRRRAGSRRSTPRSATATSAAARPRPRPGPTTTSASSRSTTIRACRGPSPSRTPTRTGCRR